MATPPNGQRVRPHPLLLKHPARQFLAVGGFIDYVSPVVGMIAEIFGIQISLMLSMPGIFFEVGLPLWLFIKGFRPEALVWARAECWPRFRRQARTVRGGR